MEHFVTSQWCASFLIDEWTHVVPSVFFSSQSAVFQLSQVETSLCYAVFIDFAATLMSVSSTEYFEKYVVRLSTLLVWSYTSKLF